jgi:DNA-binding HxlR family transcriptional regulator
MQCNKRCPVDVVMRYVGKKWSIEIVKQIFFGSRRFKDFLANNPGLSGRVLSMRLKELEGNGIIYKDVTGKHPVSIEYSLTEKGRSLNRILYEMIIFGISNYQDEVASEFCGKEFHNEMKKALGIR